MAFDRLTAYLRTAKTLTDIQYERVRGAVSGTFERQQQQEAAGGPGQRKTHLQLVFLSCAVCGIEFCYAAETAFVSPTLLKIGVPIAYMSLAWCLSPLLGLLLSPVLGSISDRCTSRLGRRRPFIISLSVGIVAGLLLVPNGKDLGWKLGDPDIYTECNCSNASQLIRYNGTIGAPDVVLTAEEPEVSKNRSSVGLRRSWASSFTGNLRPRITVDRPNSLSEFSFGKRPTARRSFSKIDWIFKLNMSEKRISPETEHGKGPSLELDEATELSANLDQTVSSEPRRSDPKESKQIISDSAHLPDDKKENSEAAVCQNIESVSLDVADSGVGSDRCLLFRRPLLGILFTVLGVVLLDCCCDACQSPCRAYLLDVSLPEDHAAGLSTFTVMAGLGGSLGYLLGGVDWERTHLGQRLGGHVRIVFTLVLVIYIVCVSLTLASVKEIPIERSKAQDKQSNKTKIKGRKYRKFTNEDSDDDDGNKEEKEIMENLGTHSCRSSDYGSQGSLPPMQQEQDFKPLESPMENGDSKNAEPLAIEAKNFEAFDETLDMSEISLGTYVKSIFRMPRSLSVLCLTNFFCWMSLVCYSLYFTDFVGQSVMDGDPKAPVGTPMHRRYDEGVRLGSIGMSLYSLSCSIYSMNIKKLVNRFGAKRVYIFSQLVYTFGSAFMALTRHPVIIVLLSPCPGVMYATLFTMPYLLLAHYHSSNKFTEEEDLSKEKQIRGLGTDIAVVSSMVFLAQFLLSSVVGSLIDAVGSPAVVMVAASVLSFCGALSACQVTYLGL